MKKIMNYPEQFVTESLEGIAKAHKDALHLLDDKRGIARVQKKNEKVAIVTGGGYGHLPLFLGYVGQGLCDGCAVGNVFTSPSSSAVIDVTRAVDAGKGVLYLIGNYMGDTMNFEMAGDMVGAVDDIETVLIRGADDIASAPKEQADERRGVAGIVYVYKIAGAAAERGLSLDEVAAVTRKACSRVSTYGVGFSPCQLPEAEAPIFQLEENQIELGIGIHGEKGQRRCSMMSAKELAEFMTIPVLEDAEITEGDRVAVLVNGLGATSREELYILYNEVEKILSDRKVCVAKSLVGEYVTSLEMAGASISVMKLDEELESLLNDPADTPFVKY